MFGMPSFFQNALANSVGILEEFPGILLDNEVLVKTKEARRLASNFVSVAMIRPLVQSRHFLRPGHDPRAMGQKAKTENHQKYQ